MMVAGSPGATKMFPGWGSAWKMPSTRKPPKSISKIWRPMFSRSSRLKSATLHSRMDTPGALDMMSSSLVALYTSGTAMSS